MTSKHQWLLMIGLCTWASIAHAHISITDGNTHVGRSEEMKGAPCGTAGQARGAMVYTYKPGETINITIKETVSHPSYFRIAFDADGDDGFETPSGSIGEMGDCGTEPACGPGKEDYCNNETVLLDHLNLHAGSFGMTPDWTFSVTLPNVECTNCTLQIIQVMNDMGIHFQPYPADDIYYQCIDLVLSNSAPDVNDTPVMNEGMVCPVGGGVGGMGGMGGVGGASMMGGSGGMGSGGGGGMGGASGGAATSGGRAGMTGQAGMMGSAGSVGGTAGASGAAGVTGAAGVGGAAAGPTTTPPPTTSNKGGSKGGCHAAGATGFGGAGAIGLSLLALGARRRRARG